MASTAASVAPPTGNAVENGVSLARLYVLRATYLLLIVGLGAINLPELISHEPMARGVIPSLLGAVWLLAFIGLRYPLQMLPLLLFELSWKTIWLLDYGLAQWMTGAATPQFTADFQAIAPGPVLFAIVIPWGYVVRHYVKKPGARWR